MARYAVQAGAHCQAVHEHLMEQPRDLGQVQADEIWIHGRGVGWLAMAMQVSTRLWLGGVVGGSATGSCCGHCWRTCGRVRCVARCCSVLMACAYVPAIQQTFREAIYTGKPGRPRLRPWDGIHIAQVVKRYQGHRVVGVVRRVEQGAPPPSRP